MIYRALVIIRRTLDRRQSEEGLPDIFLGPDLESDLPASKSDRFAIAAKYSARKWINMIRTRQD